MIVTCPLCGYRINLDNQPSFWCACGSQISNTSEVLKKADRITMWSQPKPIPIFGPGTELESLLKTLGIKAKQESGCDSCSVLRDQMNAWGVQGCIEHREQIITELKTRSEEYNWQDKAQAALNSLTLKFWINPFNPFASIVDQAIKQAQEKNT